MKIAAVDATASGDLAEKFGVKGYPTIKFFPKGSTEPEDYMGVSACFVMAVDCLLVQQ